MHREIEIKLQKFYKNHPTKAVMLLGARQVGKTYSIIKFARQNYKNVVVIDFINDASNIELLKSAQSADDLMLRISAKFGRSLSSNSTMIVFDEVQKVPKIITFIKYLVQNYPYDFILTGSLLGAILKDVISIPVGYIDIWRMCPMSFKEFMIESGTDSNVFKQIGNCVANLSPIDDYIHNHFMNMFKKYLIVGGMPEVVKIYFKKHNLARVREVQESVLKTYKADISHYKREKKLDLNEIYEAIPSELNSQNKRFILKNLNEKARFSKYERAFYWLKNAGVVLPTYLCTEAKIPLKANKKNTLFKLYMSDVGLLTYSYGQLAQEKILQNDDNINCGAIYENAMAQMLNTTNDELYYYNNKQKGEVDFLVETPEGISALEVKSGKDYYYHKALNNLFKSGNCKYATVACNSNIKISNKVLYLPIYIFGFLGSTYDSKANAESVYF